ncbi:MAG: DnaJ C-terminal domain-containing protein [Myxococcota bacterium]
MGEDAQEDLYTILGVPRTAPQSDIQAAYKKKARELHPDVNKSPDAEDKFKSLAAAYAILKDPEQRKRYDRYGFNLRPTPGAGSSTKRRTRTSGRKYRPQDFGFQDVKFEDINIDLDDLNNPFDFFLRREQRRRKTSPKKEREVQLTISLENAFSGTTLNMLLDLPNDLGQVDTRRIKLRIPPGAKEADRLKLSDPDVTVVLKIEPHPKFTLDGRDVRGTLNLSPWEAAIGASIEAPTLSGPVRLKVPAGTSSGQTLRLKGQGLPQKPGRNGPPGDMYMTTKIVVPKTLTERERELLEALLQESPFDPRA